MASSKIDDMAKLGRPGIARQYATGGAKSSKALIKEVARRTMKHLEDKDFIVKEQAARIMELEEELRKVGAGWLESGREDQARILELEAEVKAWKAEAHRLRNVIADKNLEQDQLLSRATVTPVTPAVTPVTVTEVALRNAYALRKAVNAARQKRHRDKLKEGKVK